MAVLIISDVRGRLRLALPIDAMKVYKEIHELLLTKFRWKAQEPQFDKEEAAIKSKHAVTVANIKATCKSPISTDTAPRPPLARQAPQRFLYMYIYMYMYVCACMYKQVIT